MPRAARSPWTTDWPPGDGHWRQFQDLAQIVRDEAGRPLYLQGVMLDVTEARRAEQALTLQARRSAVLLALPGAAEGMDERAFMQHGLEQAEALTESRIGYIHFVAEDLEGVELVAWSRATLEHYCTAAFDRHYPVSQAGVWADALRRRAPVVFNDYGDPAQAQRWQRVFEEAAFGLAHANAGDNTFIEVNRAFARQRGYSPEELAGRPMVDAYPPDLREAMAQRLSTIDTAHHLTFESVHVRKDGSRFPVLMEVTNIQGPDGEPVSRVAYALDITEQRRLAEELDGYRLRLEDLVASRTRELAEARTRAEAANQAKSVFLANMSHEIRTPMNAIMGLTHLIQTSGVTPDQARRLARIDEAARHLLAILNDIPDLSRIDAGHLEMEDRDFALAEVLVRFEVQDTGIGIDPGATGPAVRPLRTGGRVHHPPLRRDRPGDDHHPAPGRGHGWGVGAGASAIGGLVGPRCAGRPPPHAALGPLDGRPAAEAAGQARAVGEVVGAPPAAVRAGLARSAGAGTPAPRRPSPP